MPIKVSKTLRDQIPDSLKKRANLAQPYVDLERGMRKVRLSAKATAFLHILEAEELMVTDVAVKMDRVLPQVSLLLKEMKASGVLLERKVGTKKMYRLSERSKRWWAQYQK